MFLKPNIITKNVKDLNLEELKAKGIKGFIFDLDNTIMKPDTGYFTEDIQAWLNEVEKDFKIAIVSNNPRPDYEKKVREIVDYPIYFKAAKPSRKFVRLALKDLGLEPSEAAMVGDRPLTDIFVGQRLGMTTILVDPLIKHQEPILFKILRKAERSFVAQ